MPVQKLTDYLAKWATANAGRPLYTFINRNYEPAFFYTYGTFHERTNGLAEALINEFGVSPGEPILLAYPSGLDMIVAFMACVKAGAIPIPVPPPLRPWTISSSTERLSLIIRDSGTRQILTNKNVLPPLSGHQEAVARQGSLPALQQAILDCD